MLIVIILLIILACFVLGFFVLIQNSKGGGLASNFAGSNQIMGVRKTADFLEKATWTLAGVIMLLCLIVAFLSKNEFKAERGTNERHKIEQASMNEED
ncbi:MAG: preprotein translocase subunit SecG [Bacteroidales bacterium]|jgi:preprotein translocase subunit SecG|nr:preprotein translocase subunit SecG [Bacteroidales bacterium]